jgi:hypothetical protein
VIGYGGYLIHSLSKIKHENHINCYDLCWVRNLGFMLEFWGFFYIVGLMSSIDWVIPLDRSIGLIWIIVGDFHAWPNGPFV